MRPKEALSSSWARRLFVGDLEMAKNGRGPHCKGNRTGDFQLAAASNVFLLCSCRLPLNLEDGSFVTSDAIREADNRLDETLKAVSEGSFKPDREKDELTYALGTPKHTGCVRGMGVVPWKHGFSADIETYRSRSRKKAEQEDKMRALGQIIASIKEVMVASC